MKVQTYDEVIEESGRSLDEVEAKLKRIKGSEKLQKQLKSCLLV